MFNVMYTNDMCVCIYITFAISNFNLALLSVRLDDSTLGNIIILKDKRGVTHLVGTLVLHNVLTYK